MYAYGSVCISGNLSNPNISLQEKQDLLQCKLNGKKCIRLNQDLGQEMKPLETKTVLLDVKVHLFILKIVH